MPYNSNNSGAFFPIWKKYRPVILVMMKDAVNKKPQQYNLSKHEFEDIAPHKSTTYSFKFTVVKGIRSSSPKKLLLSEDLLTMLRGSERAWELIDANDFEFELDKKFNLHVKAVETPESED
jgi:hypothetical protein